MGAATIPLGMLAQAVLSFGSGGEPELPNNSFKPNALRYTNNMAEQHAMLLAPLRTSA